MKRGKSTFKLDKLPPSGVRTGTSERASERASGCERQRDSARMWLCRERAHTHQWRAHAHAHTCALFNQAFYYPKSTPLGSKVQGRLSDGILRVDQHLDLPVFPYQNVLHQLHVAVTRRHVQRRRVRHCVRKFNRSTSRTGCFFRRGKTVFLLWKNSFFFATKNEHVSFEIPGQKQKVPCHIVFVNVFVFSNIQIRLPNDMGL